jgi:hypothetical protein
VRKEEIEMITENKDKLEENNLSDLHNEEK